MIVTIHQPDFLPWLGFFYRWQHSDLLIFLDDVQFLRRGWHNRDRIKTRTGAQWLTVPVNSKGKFNQLIKDVEISEEKGWRKKHLSTIKSSYGNAPNFDYFFPKLEAVYMRNHKYLIDFNLELLELLAKEFKITTPTKLSSSFKIKTKSTERLIDFVEAVNGTEYLTGMGAKNYLDELLFKERKIKVAWQSYQPENYKQLYGEFISNLSSIDYLMMKPMA